MTLFPNPSKDVLTIRFASGITANAQLRLYNPGGQLVTTKQIPLMAGNTSFTLAVGGLPNGTYIVEVRSGQDVQHAKMIKE